jgi:hypothetical protein
LKADFFTSLAQCGCFCNFVFGIGAAAGKSDLPAVFGQVVGAAGEQDVPGIFPTEKGDQYGSRPGVRGKQTGWVDRGDRCRNLALSLG